MHAEHVHQKAQKSQRAPIGLDHHGFVPFHDCAASAY